MYQPKKFYDVVGRAVLVGAALMVPGYGATKWRECVTAEEARLAQYGTVELTKVRYRGMNGLGNGYEADGRTEDGSPIHFQWLVLPGSPETGWKVRLSSSWSMHVYGTKVPDPGVIQE